MIFISINFIILIINLFSLSPSFKFTKIDKEEKAKYDQLMIEKKLALIEKDKLTSKYKEFNSDFYLIEKEGICKTLMPNFKSKSGGFDFTEVDKWQHKQTGKCEYCYDISDSLKKVYDRFIELEDLIERQEWKIERIDLEKIYKCYILTDIYVGDQSTNDWNSRGRRKFNNIDYFIEIKPNQFYPFVNFVREGNLLGR